MGSYIAGGPNHGFLLETGTFITIDPPGSTSTQALGINTSGEIVGTFGDASGGFHGFLISNGTFTTIDVPGATVTQALGINTSGEIVGTYLGGGTLHGLRRRTRKWEGTAPAPRTGACGFISSGFAEIASSWCFRAAHATLAGLP